ncbi:MAG: hypothetical protein H7245_16640 [Candidatus Saccharibacteria bacterium]|nr:hypothetical protein [Pseudorhodobacter sp.]
MNSEQRNIWAALLSGLMVNTYFFARLWTMFQDGTSAAPDGMQTWARMVLWAIPASIIAVITLTILLNIGAGIITGEKPGPALKDERDRLFQLWGLGVTMATTVVGFITAVCLLALGQTGFLAFTCVYLGCALGDMAGNALKLTLYRVR